MTALATTTTRVKQTQHPKDPHGFYVEPAWAIEALLDAVAFQGEIYDPAYGSGNIVDVCLERGFEAWGTDLIDRTGGARGGVDFTAPIPLDAVSLKARSLVDNIICNPPFHLAQVFIEKALLRTRFKVAMLVRLAFLEGQKRRKLFETTPLSQVLVFSKRVSMPPGGRNIKAKGGAVAYCWMVWDHKWRGPAQIGWL